MNTDIDDTIEMNIFTKIICKDLLGKTPLPLKENMTFAVKANIGCGHEASAGSYSLRNWVPRGVSCVVRPLVASGHKIVGITNMHELALGITSENPAFGTVVNPHQHKYKSGYIAGGSSGGSAAAVAMGAVSFALGTDTGGSMLIPAALCGVVGYRPTTGLYGSTDAIVCPLSSTTDTIGIFARQVSTIQQVHKTIVPYTPAPSALEGVRIGVPEQYFRSVLDDDVREFTEKAHDALEIAEVELVRKNFPPEITEDFISSCIDLVNYEAYKNFPQYLEDQDAPVHFDKLSDSIPRRIIQSGASITKGRYEQCVQKVEDIRNIFADYFRSNRVDAFVCPTTILPAVTIPAPKQVSLPSASGEKMTTFAAFTHNTLPQAYAGVPCVSLPCGMSSAGLPIGLMVVGPHGTDNRLLDLAAAMQKAFQDSKTLQLPPLLSYSSFNKDNTLCKVNKPCPY